MNPTARGATRRTRRVAAAIFCLALCLPATAPNQEADKARESGGDGGSQPDGAEKWMTEAQKKWDAIRPLVKSLTERIKKEAKGPKWQYAVLPIESMDAFELAAKMNEMGGKGWECFSTAKLEEGGPVLLFRKREGGALSGGASDELLELLLLRLLTAEGGA
jgi:hypothetical protein